MKDTCHRSQGILRERFLRRAMLASDCCLKTVIKLICPQCDRLTQELPDKTEAMFMYNTVMSEQASIFCRQCGYDLTSLCREVWNKTTVSTEQSAEKK